ncbi:hypothetical protein RI129_007230 [Pyrocoelia pectoralis]|uniref:ESF1 homolog n=1 Tax=Pyrocoelia pectoralis TaxID=417401 RepID=A0AAN7ZER3_9COLE
MEDERFAHVDLDPKFRRIPKAERKVKIDKRFKSMFKDKQFKIKYTVDKRGRPVNHTSNEDLKRYYELDSDESSIESDSEAGKYVKVPSSDHESNSHNDLDVKDQTDGSVSGKIKQKLQNLNIDYARGESTLLSESSSDDDEDDTDEEDTVEHAWGALDADAERTDEITKCLAACNMDWDRIRATDLMVLLSSFLPPGGLIESVTIYPSEFGKKRMEEDEVKGPMELIETQREDPAQEENDGDEGSTYHMEKLRQYQLNRLKYYYAVIVCDSKNSANKIYTECDGMEYESSATKMDLRFIPDGMSFEDEPKEVCKKLPEQGKYKPRFFTTTALQQAKVDCTWDETNPDRIELTQKLTAGDEIEKDDLQAYLASSSSSENEESDHEEQVLDDSKKSTALNKYKSLLRDIENQENEKYKKGFDMEISWELDLKEKTEKLVKKKLDEKEEKTPFQQFLDKRKEKKKAKREDQKKKHTAESESDSDIPSDIDMNDPYFAEEFDKPEFKQKKNKSQPREEDDSTTNRQNAAELELLLMNTDDKKHFSLQKIQDKENGSKSKKKLKKKKGKEAEIKEEDDFKINLDDGRFSALYTSHHYNVDPTDSHYKKTRAMDAFVTEKFKRRAEDIKSEDVQVKNSDNHKQGVELKLLVKSVKRKTEALGTKIKKIKS